MDLDPPTIHPAGSDAEAEAIAELLSSGDADPAQPGIQVVVRVCGEGPLAYARVADEASTGHECRRWLRHARRGSSPGGWSERHHPRSEQHVGAWKDHNAPALDRLLIHSSKHAMALSHDAPYVVAFPAVALASCSIAEPGGAPPELAKD